MGRRTRLEGDGSRFGAAYDRPMTWPDHRFRRYLDPLIAAALTLLGQAEVWFGPVPAGQRPAVASVVAAGTLVTALRRSRPVLTVIVTCGAMAGQAALGVDTNAAFAPLLAAFLAIGTAGYLATRPLVALACAVGLIWPAVVISHGWPADASETLPLVANLAYATLLIALSWFVGRGFAVGRLQRELAQQTAAAAVARERLRIARDVHDVVAHSISVMALHAGGARRLLRPEQAAAIEALEVVESTGRAALAEIRDVLADVRAPDAGALTRASLERAVEPLRAAGLTVTLAVDDLPESLPEPVGATGHRVVREAITNVLRHADASAVHIAAAVRDDRMVIEIVDDGTPAGPISLGNGLRGMRERVAEVGGTLLVGPVERSVPEPGFRLAVDLPLAR